MEKNDGRMKKNTRKCHDCGKPCNDYRCRKCWQKLRKKSGYFDGDESDTYRVMYLKAYN